MMKMSKAQEKMMDDMRANGAVKADEMTHNQKRTAESLVKRGDLERTRDGYKIKEEPQEVQGIARTLKVTENMKRSGTMIFDDDQEWTVERVRSDGRIVITNGEQKKVIRQSTYEKNFKAIN